MEPSCVNIFFLGILTFLFVGVDSHSDGKNASTVAGKTVNVVAGQQTLYLGECNEGSVVLKLDRDKPRTFTADGTKVPPQRKHGCHGEVNTDRESIVHNPSVTINAPGERAAPEDPTCCNYSTVHGFLSSEMAKVAETYGRDEEFTKQQLRELHMAVSDIAGILTNSSEKSPAPSHPTLAPSSALPNDCSDALALGATNSSAYTVQPRDNGNPVQVYCDMETDGGGWTVFQRRQDGMVDFYRDFESYRQGFGSPDGEFWLGNDNLHRLTAQDEYELRVDLTDFEGNSAYAIYDSFSIGHVSDYYRLTVGGYSGTAGDSMSNHNDKRFSTKDRDSDDWGGNCAEQFGGAWWYAGCYKSHLNGRYFGDPYQGVAWYAWKRNYDPLKMSEMKLRKTN